MTWTKLGDEFLNRVELLRLPRGDRLLHVEALVWANLAGTDGHLPAEMLIRFTDEPEPEAAAGRLVKAGLWTVEPGGWAIVGFLEDQTSAEEVRETARANALRTKRWRHHQQGRHELCNPDRCNAARNAARNAASAATPARPDPPVRAGLGLSAKQGDTAASGEAPAAGPDGDGEDLATKRDRMARAIREASPVMRPRYERAYRRQFGQDYGESTAGMEAP